MKDIFIRANQSYTETFRELQENPYKYLKDSTDLLYYTKLDLSVTGRLNVCIQSTSMILSELAKEYIKEPFNLFFQLDTPSEKLYLIKDAKIEPSHLIVLFKYSDGKYYI